MIKAPAALELPWGEFPEPDDFVQAAMEWHFNPETGSRFWLDRAGRLGFDPRKDIRTFADLVRFPSLTDELRDVTIADLVPQGYGPNPDIIGVIESGGTTGDPKRVPLLSDFAEKMVAREVAAFEKLGVPHDKHWLIITPSGPHGALAQAKRTARAYGVAVFAVDMDPRWVKKQLAAGNTAEADAYADHILDQAYRVLRTENVGYIRLTPPILARIARRDDLVDLVREKIAFLSWGGASMDADSRYLYKTDLFPDMTMTGNYGTTMALGGGATERPNLPLSGPTIFDPVLAPYVTLNVVDGETREPVAFGERGQVVVHHLSKSFLLAGNLERDTALRADPASDVQLGDSIADIAPVQEFGGVEVIEGVY